MNLNIELYNNYIIAKNISRDQKRKLEFELKEQEKRARIKSYKK